MAGNSHDLYNFDYMTQSMTTTSRNNAMINGQDGESICRKPTCLQSLTRRYLLTFDVRLIDTSAKGKSRATPKPSATTSARSSPSTSSVRPEEAAPTPKQAPTLPPWRGGKDHGKGSRTFSHRGGDWNYTGQNYGKRNW